ncbi:MAG: SCO family protein, partial [Planctomycetota bacterium]
DTPARAAARRTSVIGEDGEPSWRFAVIHPAHQQEYLRAIGWRVQQDPETGKFAHPAGFLVLTGDGRIAQQIYGLETAPEEPRLALVEAGEGSIGTLGDRMLLMCYHYDTASRRYAVAMSTFYRAGGLAIMLGSGVGLWFLVRRARRRRQS